MKSMTASVAAFEEQGFQIIPAILQNSDCDRLISVVGAATSGRAGTRHLLASPIVAEAARIIRSHPVVASLLTDRMQVVQCTLFTKSLSANWLVAPHQDLSIPVHAQMDIPGWTGWSIKEGTLFVQPPVEVLEQLVAVRLQLDPPAGRSGLLEVVPGSHALGRLSSELVGRHASVDRVRCDVPRGGVVVMRPLLLHSSSKSTTALPRRVLHFLFGPSLPSGMRWAVEGHECEASSADEPVSCFASFDMLN